MRGLPWYTAWAYALLEGAITSEELQLTDQDEWPSVLPSGLQGRLEDGEK